MIRSTIARRCIGIGLSALALAAQADVIDQTSPVGNAGFNVNSPSLSWQQQVVTDVAGLLTRIDLFNTHNGGAVLQAFRVSINKGSGWQTDADNFSALVTPGWGRTRAAAPSSGPLMARAVRRAISASAAASTCREATTSRSTPTSARFPSRSRWR